VTHFGGTATRSLDGADPAELVDSGHRGPVELLHHDEGRPPGLDQAHRVLVERYCGGPYSVEAGRVSLRDDQCGASHLVMTARWKLEDGELTFFDIRVGRPLEWGSKPFKKIG
jgi:hypothetical protein